MAVTRCNNIKSLALDLYQALGMVCREHPEHRFALSLSTTSARQRAEFNLMYTQPSPLRPNEAPRRVYGTRSVRLKIESAMTDIVQQNVCETSHEADATIQSEFLKTQKRHRGPSPPPKKLQKARKVVFETAAVLHPSTLRVDARRYPYAHSALNNFCMKQDCCHHLRDLPGGLHTTNQPMISRLYCRHEAYALP